MNVNKEAGENANQYIWRICSAKDNGTLELTWSEVANILNGALYDDEADYLGESAYRKRYQMGKALYEDVFSKQESKKYADDLAASKRELERLKIQYRDERAAWNKQNYIDARVSQKLDYLEECLKSIGKEHFQHVIEPVTTSSDNDMLVMLTDWHIGECFNNNFGHFNAEIAKKRIDLLINEIKTIKKTQNSEKCYVFLGGDMISGNIHASIQLTNRENVIDQIKVATELIAYFCHEMCGEFTNVYLADVTGNHSRISKKEDALHDERLDSLISWAVNLIMVDNQNFHWLKHRNIDSGIVDMSIRGKTYIGVHGDFDPMSKSGVSDLCMNLGFIPYAILRGHMHTPAMNEYNGVQVIQSGSLAGSGDQYTVEKRLFGQASQTVLICDTTGVRCIYNVKLS